MLCEAAICYTGDINDEKRDKYSLKYYVEKAKEVEKMGAHILAIKDMAGLCKPLAARKLITALKEELLSALHRLREQLWLKPLMICLLSVMAVYVAELTDGKIRADWVPEISVDSLKALLQDKARTLEDKDIQQVITSVVQALGEEFNATLRD